MLRSLCLLGPGPGFRLTPTAGRDASALCPGPRTGLQGALGMRSRQRALGWEPNLTPNAPWGILWSDSQPPGMDANCLNEPTCASSPSHDDGCSLAMTPQLSQGAQRGVRGAGGVWGEQGFLLHGTDGGKGQTLELAGGVGGATTTGSLRRSPALGGGATRNLHWVTVLGDAGWNPAGKGHPGCLSTESQ